MDVSPLIVTPDGTIDLQWIDGVLRIAGPDKVPQTEVLRPGATVVALRFQSGAAAVWLGMPATEILGERTALAELSQTLARSLGNTLRPTETIEDFVASLEIAVARCGPEQTAGDPAMRAAFELIRHGPPGEAPLMSWLARALAMSERTLRRRFDESFGYGPKTLDRILRYQRYLALSRRSEVSAAILAAEAGYADQAHLVRESRRLTGSTPRELSLMLNAADGMETA